MSNDEYEQLSIDSAIITTSSSKEVSETISVTEDDDVQEVVAEVFQDSTFIERMNRGIFTPKPLPDEITKGRSRLIDEIISSPTDDNRVSVTNTELSEKTNSLVEARISLSFWNNENNLVKLSSQLSNFDREVIDAVASLAVRSQIISSAMIYRMITGKQESTKVVKAQTDRVDESMVRCSRCEVIIDITTELKNISTRKISQDEQLQYKGAAISFEVIQHTQGRHKTSYYKINSMPPFHRFAEKMGKISVFPLSILDSPVTKTDPIIAVQSYLLRNIEESKRSGVFELEIFWIDVFDLTVKEGKSGNDSENNRTKKTIFKILNYWIEKNYIKHYTALPRANNLIIEI